MVTNLRKLLKQQSAYHLAKQQLRAAASLSCTMGKIRKLYLIRAENMEKDISSLWTELKNTQSPFQYTGPFRAHCMENPDTDKTRVSEVNLARPCKLASSGPLHFSTHSGKHKQEEIWPWPATRPTNQWQIENRISCKHLHVDVGTVGIPVTRNRFSEVMVPCWGSKTSNTSQNSTGQQKLKVQLDKQGRNLL